MNAKLLLCIRINDVPPYLHQTRALSYAWSAIPMSSYTGTNCNTHIGALVPSTLAIATYACSAPSSPSRAFKTRLLLQK